MIIPRISTRIPYALDVNTGCTHPYIWVVRRPGNARNMRWAQIWDYSLNSPISEPSAPTRVRSGIRVGESIVLNIQLCTVAQILPNRRFHCGSKVAGPTLCHGRIGPILSLLDLGKTEDPQPYGRRDWFAYGCGMGVSPCNDS